MVDFVIIVTASNSYLHCAENFYRDEYSDIASACTSTPKDARIKRIGTNSVKKRVPLSFKKSGDNLIEKAQHSKAGDWSIEIAVPKTRNISLSDVQYEESEGSCVTKTCERSGGRTSTQDVEYEYVHADDKQECSSASAHFPENFESKALTVCPSVLDEVNLVKKTGRGPLFTTEEMSTEEKRCRSQIRDRHSLDSTVTESSFPTMNGCCSKTANDIASIRKQLLGIENKQTDLMDSLRVIFSNLLNTVNGSSLLPCVTYHAIWTCYLYKLLKIKRILVIIFRTKKVLCLIQQILLYKAKLCLEVSD